MKKKIYIMCAFIAVASFIIFSNYNLPYLESTKASACSAKKTKTYSKSKPKQSIASLLNIAKQPLGNCMYVWGGGWNEEDTGAGIEAVSIGVSSNWKSFADIQDSTYQGGSKSINAYKIHDGLDCSGYIGWVMYNLFNNKNGNNGYVMSSTSMAKTFSEYGWGTFTDAENVTDWKPGDIMSMKGHVWMSLGSCKDGSVVILHCSPPGVRLCGTTDQTGVKTKAVKLAEHYMKKYYPNWYKRYPDCEKLSSDYLDSSAQMRWNKKTLSDKAGIQKMSAEKALAYMFKKINN